eukprot:5385411-Amphidinium_carterae.3
MQVAKTWTRLDSFALLCASVMMKKKKKRIIMFSPIVRLFIMCVGQKLVARGVELQVERLCSTP